MTINSLFTNDHIQHAITRATQYSLSQTTAPVTVSETRDILTELEEYTHENDWDTIIETINGGDMNIHHLSDTAIVVGTSYEGFSAPLSELGYDDREIVKTIQYAHEHAGNDVFDVETLPDVYTFITTLPTQVITHDTRNA